MATTSDLSTSANDSQQCPGDSWSGQNCTGLTDNGDQNPFIFLDLSDSLSLSKAENHANRQMVAVTIAENSGKFATTLPWPVSASRSPAGIEPPQTATSSKLSPKSQGQTFEDHLSDKLPLPLLRRGLEREAPPVPRLAGAADGKPLAAAQENSRKIGAEQPRKPVFRRHGS